MLLIRRLCTRGSCPPPCPRPSQAPKPECRPGPAPHAAATATRIVCCPPPAGQRPPCPPRLPVCARTCETHAQQLKAVPTKCLPESAYKKGPINKDNCGEQIDQVMKRKALAKLKRQQDYEAEVARGEQHFVDTGKQVQFGKRHGSALATDGRIYPLACPMPSTRRCRPPPPEVIPLASDSACAPSPGGSYVDPCHQRTIVEIDRSCDPKLQTRHAVDQTFLENNPLPKSRNHNGLNNSEQAVVSKKDKQQFQTRCTSTPKESRNKEKQLCRSQSLSDRIKETFNIKSKKKAGKECPRHSCSQGRVDDRSWCSQKSVASQGACREPTLSERLRWRPRNSDDCGQTRNVHTTSHCFTANNATKLQQVLNERLTLNETGRGRELRWFCDTPKKPSKNVLGYLQMQFPVKDKANDVIHVEVYTIPSSDGSTVLNSDKPANQICSQKKPTKQSNKLNSVKRPDGALCKTDSKDTNLSSQPQITSTPKCSKKTKETPLKLSCSEEKPAQRVTNNVNQGKCPSPTTTTPKICDSWLSIKGLQKKMSSSKCGKEENPKTKPT